MPEARSTNTLAPCTIEPESGRTKPAIVRSTVVLPLPDGPKSTVQGLVNANLASSEMAPTRCSILTVSNCCDDFPGRLSGLSDLLGEVSLSDNVGLPSVDLPHRGQKIDCQ